MSMIEPLEKRQLMVANITEITPDNRGEVIVQFSEAVRGVQKSSVRMYTFGTDGIANTSDDVRLNTVVKYDSARKRLVTRVIGNLPANVGYRIRIQAKEVRSAVDGSQLDGEYKSDGSSGNGVGNGNYNARFRQDKNATPRVRLSTTAGLVDLIMRKDVAPLSVANFLKYADSGRYDGIFVNRVIPGFIVQLGAARVTGDGSSASNLEAMTKFAPVQNEFNLSNVLGTVAFAKSPSDPNSATSDFFFNLADNSSNLDNQNGGFTVFATVANSGGQLTVNETAAKPIVALQNTYDGNPAGNVQSGITGTGLSDVPVNSIAPLNTEVTEIDFNQSTQQPISGRLVKSGLVPNRDLVIVRRASLLLKTSSVS